MEQNDSQQLLLAILDHAHEDPPLKFTYILSWDEYRYFQGFEKSARIVIKVLKSTADKLIKEYCKDVIAGISDITKQLAYLQILDIADYYIADLEIIQQMVKDYDDYLGDCNFLNFVYAFLGAERET